MKDRIYFPNLNAIRFIAALLVFISHVELNKRYFNIPNYRYETKILGSLGVDLFFVLSGFLITFLLLKEKEKYLVINFKNFYLRRIFRIWPLYYFVILLSLFILPKFDLFFIPGQTFQFSEIKELFKILGLFFFLMPNVLLYVKEIPFATQTWSIGTEEQFYLIWPHLISKVKKLKLFLILVIILYWVFFEVINFTFFDSIKYFELFRNYYKLFQIDTLSVGALGAYLLFKNDVVLLKIINNKTFFLSIILLFGLYFLDIDFTSLKRNLYSFVFIVLILNLVGNKKLSTLLENKILDYLGKISYGLYMYHQIAIVFVIALLKKEKSDDFYVIYLGSFLITVLISHLSYKFLEKPFLNFKLKYAPFSNEK